MSDQAKDPAAAFAEELAKQLPIKAAYRDIVKPGAKQAGQLIQDLVKVIQLALAPLQLAGAYQDRLRAFIDRSVRAVPEENRVSPAPQILGPIVEGLRYEPEGTPLDEMFSKLLSSSMDATRLQNAHPAFVPTIRNLSSDEARLLVFLADRPVDWQSWNPTEDQSVGQSGHPYHPPFRPPSITFDMVEPADLAFPENVSVFFEHLRQLGLIETVEVRSPEGTFRAELQEAGVWRWGRYQMTTWGRQFLTACTSVGTI